MGLNFTPYKSLDASELRESISEYIGWTPLVDKLLQDLDGLLAAVPTEMQLLQIKEKLGQLRLYYRLVNTDSLTEERIRELVDTAVAASATTCVRCSATATIQHMDGWLAPMCEEHAREQEFRF